MDENRRLIDNDDNISYGTEAITINNPKWKEHVAVVFVLITETLERLAFYGLLCNMALSLNSDPLLWCSYNAIHAVMIFTGLSYAITIFGGWMADSLLGKFWTITIFFLIYITGSCMWSSLYWHEELHFNCSNTSSIKIWCDKGPADRTANSSMFQETCFSAILLILALIGAGYGCVRVNIVPFGAQQVEDQGQFSLRAYFNWLYWCINVGSFVGFGVFGYIQQDVSYFYGYLGPTLALLVAWGVFVSGSWTYRKRSYVMGSPLKNIAKVICSSIQISLSRTWQCLKERSRTSDNLSCLERSSVANGGQCQVEHVQNTRALLKVLLIFLCLIPYWITYYQTQSTFLIQGMHMKLDFINGTSNKDLHGTDSFKIPLAWLSLFNVAFVILIVPLLDRVIYPCLDSLKFNLTVRSRVIFGMFFSTAAMLVAGYVEGIRLKRYWGEDNKGHPYIQYIACTKYYAADMSILWQIPQYLLIAFSEVFTSIAGLEMAYVCAPQSMQSLIIGFYYFAQGLGALAGTLVVLSLETVWFYSYDFGNINCERSPFAPDSHLYPGSSCHLDYYFYLLAAVQVFGIIIFALVAFLMNIGGNLSSRRLMMSRRPRDD